MRKLEKSITHCRRCPRLVAWREKVAHEKTKRFLDWNYWGKPVPGFGDLNARLLIVGLAPAAHGANRTGRMFTGDKSGEWLYRALHKAGFANKANSEHRNDGLLLKDCYITAACRCAPPDNKPTPNELKTCRPFLLRELALLRNVRVVLGLGKIGFDNAFDALLAARLIRPTKRPIFKHGATIPFIPLSPGRGIEGEGVYLLASYHPSQQNTFTGKLTEAMFDQIFIKVKTLL